MVINGANTLGRYAGGTSLDGPGSAKAVFKNWLLTFARPILQISDAKPVYTKKRAHVNF